MANHICEEEFSENYFEKEPMLRIHNYIINSLYDQGINGILDCTIIAREFRVSESEVEAAAHEINYCIPEAVIIKNNSTYEDVIITAVGRNVLQYDLCKTIPLEGISSDNLKSISISNLLKEFLHNKWLCINRSSKNIRYERGPKYSNFVALYTSLYQYYKTNYLTNKEKLVHAKWIKTIEGRLEIIRGLKFPSVVDEKLVLFYKLLERIYMQKFEAVKITSGAIQLKKMQVISDPKRHSKEIVECNLNTQHQNFSIMQKWECSQRNPQAVSWQKLPGIASTQKLVLEQLQKSINRLASPQKEHHQQQQELQSFQHLSPPQLRQQLQQLQLQPHLQLQHQSMKQVHQYGQLSRLNVQIKDDPLLSSAAKTSLSPSLFEL